MYDLETVTCLLTLGNTFMLTAVLFINKAGNDPVFDFLNEKEEKIPKKKKS